jgi:hypothetical protein
MFVEKRQLIMKNAFRALGALALLVALDGCYYYPAVPVTAPQPTVQQRFDRSWSAAQGAMVDQGLTITEQDRGAGVIRGERGGVTITASVTTRADGSIQVQFNSKEAAGADAGLIHRISDSYERRMGR